MTVSTDAEMSSGHPGAPLLAEWRTRAEELQVRRIPVGGVVVSCPSRVGLGGLGRHLQELLDAVERSGESPLCICEEPTQPSSADLPGAPSMALALERALRPLTRLSPPWRMWAASVAFDADAAQRLPPAEHLIAFNGTALAQFAAARESGYRSLSLVAANSHFHRVVRQHAQAQRAHPGIERPWVTRLLRRNLAEYKQVERIYVSSNYIRDSFLEEGFMESELALFPLTPHPRFQPRTATPSASTFDVVYAGSLMVHKGVPLLIDAFRRLAYPDMRLRLIGGWSTRGMRRLIEAACTADPRISFGPGDPLEALTQARLYVHPAYEDGFAYAPAEALACGVPVLVSEDTGMKELLTPGVNGMVLPTGAIEPLAEAIHAVYRGEALGG